MKENEDQIIKNEIDNDKMRTALKGIHRICEVVLYGNDTEADSRRTKSDSRVSRGNIRR
jgi:hypothetical protein